MKSFHAEGELQRVGYPETADLVRSVTGASTRRRWLQVVSSALSSIFTTDFSGKSVQASRLDNIPTSWYALVMERASTPRSTKTGARQGLLDAALSLIRERGYSSTSVDEICARAGVTKGAFFHHFKSKDALAVAAANHWSETTGAFFETAPYHQHSDPLDRVLGYLDFRKAILQGEIAEFTCLVGTMVQEIYGTNPDIRDACEASICGHAANIEADIAKAIKHYRIRAAWTAESLAMHTQAVIQGAFIIAKAKGGATMAAASLDHLHRYITLLFQPAKHKRKEMS